MQPHPLNDSDNILEQTAQLFKTSPITASELAERAGLTRQTVAAVLKRAADPRLSSLAAVLQVLGYDLVPVPRELKREVVAYINHGARATSLPAGTSLPLSVAQQVFHDQGGDLSLD